MAGVLKTHLAQNKYHKSYFSHDIFFSGALLSTTRASLVIELLKYFLYERQQIPLPVDQLESLVDNSVAEQVKNEHLVRRKFSSGTSPFHKLRHLLDNLRQLSEKVTRAFEVCPEIEQVAVLFGGTVVSPKESYIIKLPPSCPDADSLPLEACKRNLFQQVIGEDFLGSLSSHFAPTNMTVLISAPRTCPLQWFLPKQTLKFPKLGTVMSLNFSCSYLVPICHDLTMADGDFELSGLELIDCSQCESDGAGSHKESLEGANRSAENSGEVAEAGSATGDSDDAIPTKRTSRHSEVDAVSLSTLQRKEHFVDAASPSPSLPRFCKHQRLNYIYSSQKNTRINLENVAGQTTMNPTIQNTLEETNFAHISQKMKRLTLSPAVSEDCKTDCIWYQSPVVIKGLKFEQDMFPGKS